ncbi:hypothetical protein NliqN6_5761 [Naganishia liquefaciens]|uniref:Leucine-rich repeat domain-containing protein n=1 Tax=Naganishia liquefaciens TaxID=104408 RepID=A0A8H3U060_9TREE|nr:hypothetical protein NliqN6_5761 [Naganishia liquefaciens]
MPAWRPNSSFKTGTTPAASQDFRIPEDVLEEVFRCYLTTLPWDVVPRAPPDPTLKQWSSRQGDVAELLLLSKVTKPILEKVLYSSPYLPTVDRLCAFASSVLKGDSRWDSLKRIPYSTPGRYVQVLDLSHLDEPLGEASRDEEFASTQGGLNSLAGNGLRLNGCLNTLFPLLPHLEVLILPSSIPVAPSTLRALQSAPSRSKAKVIHGLVLTQAVEPKPIKHESADATSDLDSMIRFLKAFPNLRDVSIKGYGDIDPGFSITHNPQPPLDLQRLESMTLHGVKSGLFIGALCDQEASLPSLRRLDLTCYAHQPGDLTVDLLRVHGSKLHSLTLRAPTDWPPLRIPPPSETLFLCPHLQVLKFLDSNTLPPTETFEDPALPFTAAQHCSLRHLSISKWSTAPAFRDGPHPPSTGQFEQLIETLIRNLPPNLDDVTVEGFTWLRKPLGKAGMSAGVNGVCRRLSGALAVRGVRMLDKDGTERPDVTGMSATAAFGMTSLARGLQHAGGPRLGMKGFGERRRPSMDGDVDDESG